MVWYGMVSKRIETIGITFAFSMAKYIHFPPATTNPLSIKSKKEKKYSLISFYKNYSKFITCSLKDSIRVYFLFASLQVDS